MRDLSSSEVSLVGGGNDRGGRGGFFRGYIASKAIDTAIEHGPEAIDRAGEGMNDYVDQHGAPSSLSNPSAPTIPAPPNPDDYG